MVLLGPTVPHTDFEVANQTKNILYITPVDATPGRPVVIEQLLAFTQRDIPLQPNSSVSMMNFGEEHTLSGIAVCRTATDCRLATDWEYQNRSASDRPYPLPVLVYRLKSFDGLPAIEPGLLLAMRSHRQYSFDVVLWLTGILVPVVLFLSWLYLVARSRAKNAGS